MDHDETNTGTLGQGWVKNYFNTGNVELPHTGRDLGAVQNELAAFLSAYSGNG
jgi:hypothetical protein